MPELSTDDAHWFASVSETHQIRPATPDEPAAFEVRRIGFSKLLTVVRRSAGAKASYGSEVDSNVEQAIDCERAKWFDADLAAAAIKNRTQMRPAVSKTSLQVRFDLVVSPMSPMYN